MVCCFKKHFCCIILIFLSLWNHANFVRAIRCPDSSSIRSRKGFASYSSGILVRPVKTLADDVTALADLRYDEWIVPSPYRDTTSRASFRAATAEIVAERTREGAKAFLAFLTNSKSGPNLKAIGAAELSPIELKDATISGKPDFHSKFLYVTDVVTAQRFRRRGVAKALMNAMADAAEPPCTHLVLHVDSSNTAAMQFYQSSQVGFDVPTPELLQSLDTERLAQNAGTVGQILLVKAIRTH
jgi:ribosomal protein S18 acetylase RimI-like enzyme